MDEFQPIITPPRTAYAPTRQASGVLLPPLLPCTPLPEPPFLSPGSAYPASMLGRQLLLRRLHRFRPPECMPDDEKSAFPIFHLASEHGRRTQTEPVAARAGVVCPPAYTIHGYFSSKTKLGEPGLGEALLGCSTLLLAGMLLLAILYYLSL